MAKFDSRVDAYIEKSAGFARPILRHLRSVVHEAAPELEETMKWGVPHFTYKGIVCGMASFKAHCALGFWKESLIFEPDDAVRQAAMGQFGRITSVEELPPPDVLMAYVREAVRLNELGVKAPRAAASPAKETRLPESFRVALERDPAAMAAFERLAPSHRREYAEWIAEAKREATRERRIATALEWIAEGKSRNWKYMKRGS